MFQNVIHVPTLMDEYKTGLIFSLIEGLKIGKSLKLVCDGKPVEFEKILSESGLSNIKWVVEKNDTGSWEMSLLKQPDVNSEHVGCCGMCGGGEHSSERV